MCYIGHEKVVHTWLSGNRVLLYCIHKNEPGDLELGQKISLEDIERAGHHNPDCLEQWPSHCGC